MVFLPIIITNSNNIIKIKAPIKFNIPYQFGSVPYKQIVDTAKYIGNAIQNNIINNASKVFTVFILNTLSCHLSEIA